LPYILRFIADIEQEDRVMFVCFFVDSRPDKFTNLLDFRKQ